MISLIISLLLIIVLWILKKYTKIMSLIQFRFIIFSSILYIFLFGFVISTLTISNIIKEDYKYIPLIFYILWYISSISVSNLFTGNNNYQGFFDNSNKYMSERM